MASERFTRPSILNLNRKLLERKAREEIQAMDATPDEKLIAFEDFMENIDKHVEMFEQQAVV